MARESLIEAVKNSLKLQEQKYTWKKMIIGQYVLADQDGTAIIFRSNAKASNAAYAAGAKKGKFIPDTGYTKKGKPYRGYAIYVKEPPE